MKTLHTFENAVSAVQETDSKIITADVVFGSPAKKCAGIGICKVNPYNSLHPERDLPCCQRVVTNIRKAAPDQLEFRFSRRLICKKLISRQFAFSRFRIENELTMPAWLTEQLALPEVSLVKGAYPVFFAENYIWVCIRVRSVD